jgi:type I restriction enzyme S subunit
MILEKNTEFKESKLGLIPVDWNILSIGSVFDFLKTNSLSRSQLNNEKLDEASIFNIHYGDIHSSFNFELLDLSKQEKLPKIIDNGVLKSIPDFLKDGDLIIADASEDYLGLCDCVELINIGDLKLVSGLHTFALRDKSNNFADGFKSYVFKNQNVIKNIVRIATGISVLGVTKSNLSKLLIPVPPLKEQKKIAQILSTWDEAIETTQSLIRKIQLRKKGLMQQLLSGEKRLTGFSDEWENIKLGDITYRITKKNTELNDNVITISAKRGFVKQEDYFKKRVASKTLSGYYIIEKGDFAYNKSYSNGYPMGAFKRLDNLDKAVVTTLYICFSIKDNVDSDFLLNYFEGGLMVNNLMKVTQEGGRAHGLLNIGLKDFFNLKMTIPSINEQKEISKVLNVVDEEIRNKELYLNRLQEQKKGLMQQLLTGQKRVK